MKTCTVNFKVRTLTLAVEAVLLAMYTVPVRADEADIAALTMPTNTMEFGGLYTPQSSSKFGEYTGINKDGGYLNGNFNIRGGDAYGDANGTRRWEIYGTDLGLTSRSAGATISNQGQWSVGVNYDELVHYGTTTFQTPYQGTNGGDIFTLPGFGAAANTRALSPAQLGQFHELDLSSKRDNTTLNTSYVFNRQWEFKLDFNHLDQSGAKLQSFGSSTFGGATGQKISLLPMPTNSRTETATAALNWVGEQGHATMTYYGSFYRDNNNGFKFDTFSTAVPVLQTFGTPPNNNYQKISVDAGYTFSPRTKLAGGLSYAYNTQDTAYAYDTGAVTAGLPPSPTTSLNGSVANVHADVKLTDQTTKDLALSASAKYDDRDNRTSSNIYSSRAIDGANIYNYPNTPLSIKRTGAEFAADYRVDPKQKIRVALNYDQIDRNCDQYAAGGGGPGLPVTAPPYAPGTNCVTAVRTKDPKFNATYRLKASDDLNFNIGYGYSARRTSFDTNARAAMINVNYSLPQISGLNAGDYNGFHPYFEASRNQNMLKIGSSWQASEKLSFTATGRYALDDYLSVYGVQRGTSWSADIDSTYNFREKGAVTLYLTQQQRTRKVLDAQDPATANATRIAVVPYNTWSNNLRDIDSTIGLNVKQGGLMDGKLDVAGDLTYSLGKSDYDTLLNYQSTTTTGLTCADPTILSCGSLPEIRNAMIQLKLNGTYQLEKNAKLAFGYLYRNLQSTDFYYNGYQYGFTGTGVLPTNQQPPSYHVNLVFASFIYSFK